MRACLYYFSGTGNTEKIAKLYAASLGMPCDLYRIRYPFDQVPDPRAYDLLGFGYPIHAFNTPRVAYRFIHDLPIQPGQRYFLFKTSGEPLHPNACSSKRLIHALRKKGAVCLQEFHYIMPYNTVFRHSDGMAKKMWVYAQKMVVYNCRLLNSGASLAPSFHALDGWYTVPFRIEHPFAPVNGHHFKVDEKKCIHCGHCISNCPLGNISEVNGRIVFGKRCAFCLGCSFYCPTKAIQPGIFHHGWWLNGDYHLEDLEKDPQVVMPKKSHEKKFNKSYDQYFARCDRLLGDEKPVL
jgi:ferredoxin